MQLTTPDQAGCKAVVLLDNTPSEQWRVSSPLSSSSTALAASSQGDTPVLMIREADWRRADTQVTFELKFRSTILPFPVGGAVAGRQRHLFDLERPKHRLPRPSFLLHTLPHPQNPRSPKQPTMLRRKDPTQEWLSARGGKWFYKKKLLKLNFRFA